MKVKSNHTGRKPRLRKIFQTMRKELRGDWREQHNEELHDLNSSLNFIQIIYKVGWDGGA
jgi:hypothetical protein